jgi:hypothetical protein
MVGFGLSGLAGFAVASVGRQSEKSLLRATVGVVAVAVVVLGAQGGRLKTWPVPVGENVPPVYRWLASDGEGAPLLELPIGPDLGAFRRNAMAARAMYFSTYHWLPTLNGHTGYPPASYALIEGQAAKLPDPSALQVLVDCTGLRWILVHGLSPKQTRTWEAANGASLKETFRHLGADRPHVDRLYEVNLRSQEECTFSRDD